MTGFQYSRFVLILVLVITFAEYAVMRLLDMSGLENHLSLEAEAVVDSLLLLVISAGPIYLWVIKPIFSLFQAHRDELARLVEALDGAGDAVILTDVQGTITYVNKAFSTITGFSESDAIGNNPRILQSGRQARSFYQTMWDAILATGEWEGELWNKRKNGEEYLERLYVKAIYDGKGTIKSYVGIINDITESKQQERILRQSQKMEAVGTLVGGVAHNFNNLLAAIIGKVFLMSRNNPDTDTMKHLQDVESIASDGATIVKQLLSFAHEKPQQKLHVPIIEVLKDASHTAQLTVREDIDYVIDFSDEELVVYCDAIELKQVLINLIKNASDALEGSEIRRITISAHERHREACRVSRTCDNCHERVIVIGISDTGSGIAPKVAENIFDPFFTTKGENAGTGLGLSMAKGTIEAHGGKIHVANTGKLGTTFEICLPLSTHQVDGKLKRTDLQLADASETLLVIDDDPMVRATLSDIALNLGYKVLTAQHGEEGMQAFHRHADEISLVITDVVMPVMDGYAVVKDIRNMNSEFPIMLITGYDKKQEKDRFHGDPMIRVVSKPFNIAYLSSEIHELISQYKTRHIT